MARRRIQGRAVRLLEVEKFMLSVGNAGACYREIAEGVGLANSPYLHDMLHELKDEGRLGVRVMPYKATCRYIWYHAFFVDRS